MLIKVNFIKIIDFIFPKKKIINHPILGIIKSDNKDQCELSSRNVIFNNENQVKLDSDSSINLKRYKTVGLDLIAVAPLIKKEMIFDEILSTISNGLLGLGVIVEDGNVQGIITDGDITRILRAEKEKALSLTAGDFYTANPFTIDSHEKIVIAEELMQQKKVTALVVTENKKFIGIIHRYDI